MRHCVLIVAFICDCVYVPSQLSAALMYAHMARFPVAFLPDADGLYPHRHNTLQQWSPDVLLLDLSGRPFATAPAIPSPFSVTSDGLCLPSHSGIA